MPAINGVRRGQRWGLGLALRKGVGEGGGELADLFIFLVDC